MYIITVDHESTHDNITVTIDILGHAVHHNVSSQLQWLHHPGGQECVVNYNLDMGRRENRKNTIRLVLLIPFKNMITDYTFVILRLLELRWISFNIDIGWDM